LLYYKTIFILINLLYHFLMSMMTYPTLESFVGNTPLIRLQRLTHSGCNTILLELEGNNPAGSVKDRPALSMISRAEARGDIKPGDRLIEATSGKYGNRLSNGGGD
jgi:cysteine synthase B